MSAAAHAGPAPPASSGVGPPLWLLLELTYRCPLHCVFCYNPTDFARTGAELPTADWLRVLREARALGAVQLHWCARTSKRSSPRPAPSATT